MWSCPQKTLPRAGGSTVSQPQPSQVRKPERCLLDVAIQELLAKESFHEEVLGAQGGGRGRLLSGWGGGWRWEARVQGAEGRSSAFVARLRSGGERSPSPTHKSLSLRLGVP